MDISEELISKKEVIGYVVFDLKGNIEESDSLQLDESFFVSVRRILQDIAEVMNKTPDKKFKRAVINY